MLPCIQIFAYSEDPLTRAPVLRADLKVHTSLTENTALRVREDGVLDEGWCDWKEEGIQLFVLECGGGKESKEHLHIDA